MASAATQGLIPGDEVLAFLGEASAGVSATLDYERALASAAAAPVPRFADWCGIDVVEPDAPVRHVVSGELAPAHEALLAELRDGDCAGVVRSGPRVHLVEPLIARERTLGAITFLLTEPGRHYGDSDVGLASELARRLAVAVDNARLFEQLERASLRVSFLGEASATVGTTLDYEQVLTQAATAAVPRFADWCGVDVVQPDGSLRQITSPMDDPAVEALLMELRRRYRSEFGASAGAMRAIATGEPELRTDTSDGSEIELRPGEHAHYERLSPQSYMIVPLAARERILGAMTFLSTTPGRHYHEPDLQLATELARRLALAVDNARLYEETARVRDRLAFLVEASELLSQTLDIDITLGRLADLSVPRLADWCRAYVVEPDGELNLVAIRHADRSRVALAEEMQRRYPVCAGDPEGAARVIRTGEPRLLSDVTDEALVGAAKDAEHLRMLREHGLRSALMVPIPGREGPLGAIVLTTAESGRRLAEDDLNLAEELARRAGSAIENARLHAAVAEAAARSEEALGLLIDGVRDYAIVRLDPEGNVESWNKGAERIEGYSAHDIVGNHFSTFYTPEDIARGHPERELEVAARDGRYEEEGWRVRRDGSRFWANVIITALRTEDGQLRGYAKVTRDMTARKQAEQELRRSNEELERYAYVASHDLSEPLRAIGGFAALLRRRYSEKLGDEGDGFIDAITEGVVRMKALIDDLLAFSRLGSSARDSEPVAIEAVVEESVRALASAIADVGGQVQIEGTLPVVSGKPSQLTQLFQNLIGNGLKFAAYKPPVVVVSASRSGDDWLVSVRDNGIGVDVADRERIFEVFERLHGRDDFGGTGVGLAICRKVVELHGGRIWVDDAPGGGADFRFTLPAA
jgi:PAS domain S-box-containing protein